MAVSILRETSSADAFKPNHNSIKRVTFADEVNTIIPTFSLTTTPIPPVPPNTPNIQPYQHYHHYYHNHHHHHKQQQPVLQQDQLSDTFQSEHDTNTEGSTIVSRTSSKRLCRRCRRRNRRIAEEEERKKRRKHANGKEIFITKKRSSNDLRTSRSRKDSTTKKSYSFPPSEDADVLESWYDNYNQCNNQNYVDDRRKTTSKKRSKNDEKDKENKYDNCPIASNQTSKLEKKSKNKKKERVNGKSTSNISRDQAAASKLDEEINRLKSTGVLGETRKFLTSFLSLDKTDRTLFDVVDARTLYKMLLEFRRKDCPKRLRAEGIRSRMIREEESVKTLVKKRNEKTSEYIGMDKKENKKNRAKLEDFVESQLYDQDIEFLEECSKSQLEKLAIKAVATRLRFIKDRAREKNGR